MRKEITTLASEVILPGIFKEDPDAYVMNPNYVFIS
jgi:hypothetical protein